MRKGTPVAVILTLIVIFAVGMLAVGCGDSETAEGKELKMVASLDVV